MDRLPLELNIITLNCWGLKGLSKQRGERLAEIGRQLAAADPAPHIVGLQECWTQEDYEAIRHATRFVLPYAKFYHSGVFGGGLAILSRWPITESSMVRYPLNGRPTAFYRGDWFVGKGVACAKIRYGPGPTDLVEVFNTHTHAPYQPEPRDGAYVCHRVAQAWELAKLVRGAVERGHLVLALGDLNSEPDSLPYRLVASLAPVRDVWRVLHPESRGEKASRGGGRTAELNLREHGVTSDSAYNTWRWSRARQKLLGRRDRDPERVPPDAPDPRGKRLDYIFAGAGNGAGGEWTVRSARVGMTAPHPELGCSLSDHFSVEATLAFVPALQLQPPPSSTAAGRSGWSESKETSTIETGSSEPLSPPVVRYAPDNRRSVQNGTYLQSPTHSELRRSKSYSEIQSEAADATPPGVPASTYAEILGMVRAYVAREQAQQRWRAVHFFAWVVVAVVCLIAVWFSPRNAVAFVLMLVSTLGLTAGTMDGLISLLFFNTELRALREFEWEIENAKAIAESWPSIADGRTHGLDSEQG